MTRWITVSSADAWTGKSIKGGWVVFNPLAPGIENMVRLVPLVSEAATQDDTFTTYEPMSWCLAFREKHANSGWLLCSGM